MAFTIPGFIPSTEKVSEGVSFEIPGLITPNQALQKLKTEQEAQMLAELRVEDPAEIPEMPTEGTPDSGQKTAMQRAREEIKQRFAPVVNPVMEVVNAVNAGIYGTAFDLAVAPYEVATGKTVDRPAEIQNQTYVPDLEYSEFLDKGAFYASLGVSINMAARALVNQFGKNMAINSGIRSGYNPVTGKPFSRVGGESAKAGITRDIASTSTAGEVAIGLAMASAGQTKNLWYGCFTASFRSSGRYSSSG